MTEHYMTEERHMIQDVAREFVKNEVTPIANELDPIQGEIPISLREKMGEMGYFGIQFPEEHGGMGLGVFEYCLVTEELARGWMSVASIIARASSLMNVGGWPEDKRRELTARAARGDYLAAVSLSEPDVGSDLKAVSCKAVLDGDEWVITGNKYWCTFADGADYIQLLARVDAPGEQGKQYSGLRNFIIEKERGKLPEGCAGSAIPKIGYFGWNTFELAFDGCRIPKENIITGGSSGGGDGFKNTVNWLNVARAHTAARSIGLARGALEDAIDYSHERVQFGVPISDFQETRFKLARMAAEIEAARQLMYHVATLMDTGQKADQEASMVKWYASEMAERVTSDALQILGGAGYTKLHAVERHWRDARLTKIFEGTSEIQLRIISDRMLGKPTRVS
ncbi:MAG: acyl-CoA dehydrogenase family protein [Pseudomonadales bacterium]|jgi:acyl-CoA dehydrogenase|nr:acyl-CoA dehydrogenase family protein [Pseudomonadales bacterium]MDP6470561.1 acyl-CoA dehydrogenase family protein [Pseudomonadales bacterium]MDP6827863.1 acyl-CoA dehydrogenase family protein [Pseudomonadales bacterium]MDP6970548.1 acyl-CoA dehydrogenase family protein [Pseudomonadales bacterium]|tara:strand:+ start:389 stop:1576 length:1188 start_codon:yes stop_codon:yes gene_type:complete